MEAPGMGKLDVKRINYGKVKFFNRWGLNMCGSSIVGKFMATNY